MGQRGRLAVSRADIYASSLEADAAAAHLEALAQAQRGRAKELRWANAPEWANCIVRPSPRGVEGEVYHAKFYPDSPRTDNDPAGEDDWRWANRDNYGWIVFANCRTPEETGRWIVTEQRP